MEIQKEFLTLVQLMSMLIMFYWSATWNIPPNFDSIGNPTRKPQVARIGSCKLDVLYPEGFLEDKHSIVIESFKSVKSETYKALKISPSTKTLPSFDAWKKEELTKHETDLHRKVIKHSYQKRKLNYSSAKCGAKILSSNPEAFFRMSVLNEKIDEYMLNPCHVASTWFVIELCDTIEATQIELANYELFSSSPRKFSSYWSDVYPTQRWHPLGSFQAKDQRSTQTFDIREKNLGKFIKVVISSYYGNEHFCLLSVFRVLGYSMIYDFDNYENPKNHVAYSTKEETSEIEYNRPLRKEFGSINTRASIQKYGANPIQFCHQSSLSKSNTCLHEPICLLLNLKGHFVQFNNKRKVCYSGIEKQTFPSNESKENTCKSIDYFLQCIITSKGKFDSGKGTKHITAFKLTTSTSKIPVANTILTNDKKMKQKNPKKRKENIIISESAALIQKESVLSKLTHRIKTSEMSLSLINRYLQQLSESYRQQMEDMQIMFNGTMKAISLASEKAAAIDEQQQTSLEKLEQKVNSLDQKVEHFANGQENLLKQLVELHGFFLILEFIIVSTLFSIFVNNLKRRNSFLKDQTLRTEHSPKKKKSFLSLCQLIHLMDVSNHVIL